MLKNFCLLLLIISSLLSCSENEKSELMIIPQPQHIEQLTGQFEITEQTVLFVNDSSLTSIAQMLSDKIDSTSYFQLAITDTIPVKNFISFILDPAVDLDDEGYKIDATEDSVKIIGKSTGGVFYGLQTLLQLLPSEVESDEFVQHMKWLMPCVKIEDAPRFKWRGMHLDVCRHFVPVENIKKHLDMMAMVKLNTFHWHLTEDQAWRIEIKQYPKLTEIGSKRIEGEGFEYEGFYTQDEIKEVVAYADARHITVVPEIELPGHALAALAAYPEYSCTGGPFQVRNTWGVEPNVFCAGKEETFTFLENIIDEVVELFPSPYFHIGGDECPKDRWKECPLCQKRIKEEGLKDEHELQSYFVKRIEKILVNHGKTMIGWDEIMEGGLAESAAVMSWRGEEGGIEAANQGHDVVMTPGNWCYLDHYQGDHRVEPVAIGGYTTLEEVYGYEPVPSDIGPDKEQHILGAQGNVWTEYMYTPDLVEYRVYPRILALAEVNWTAKDQRDYDSFVYRLDNLHRRMDLHHINYHIPLPEGPVDKMVFVDNIKLKFSNTRNLDMVYTTDGTKPTEFSNFYQKPLIFASNKTIKIATMLNTGKMSPVRTIRLIKSDYINAVKPESAEYGLMEAYTVGHFLRTEELDNVIDWTNRINSMKPDKEMKRDGHENERASVFTGYLNVPEDGIYEFSTNLDQFSIANQLLIDNNGEVKRFSRHNSTIALRKGKHPVKLVYLNNITGGWPQAWNGPQVQFRLWGDDEFTTVSADMYSH
nr:family 20 glycosylhydrolase [uncultured Carboxylicivirga sp.]